MLKLLVLQVQVVGKTSLKSLLEKLLEIYGNTYFSPKSFNNNIG